MDRDTKDEEVRRIVIDSIKKSIPDAKIILPEEHDNEFEDWLSGRDTEIAKFKNAQEAYSQDPTNKKALIEMADFFKEEGMYDKLILVYDAILEFSDDISVLFNKGVAMAFNRQFDSSCSVFIDAEKSVPLCYQCIINEAFCLNALKRFDDAKACYERGIQEFPTNREAYFGKARLLSRSHRPEDSVEFIKSFVYNDSISMAHNSRILCLAFIGEFERQENIPKIIPVGECLVGE